MTDPFAAPILPIPPSRIFVHQIFYDDVSRARLLPGFIPLDNTANERPDWFEFWVILKYLREHTLEDGAWYGFLSPKFRDKTGFESAFVLDLLAKFTGRADVATFSAGWDQIAYFLNPWEQGETWHPGLLAAAQKFHDEIGGGFNLSRVVTDSTNSVLSNYVVATKRFWTEWQVLAEAFFERVERAAAGDPLAGSTHYGDAGNPQPMKTFVQERFATWLLLRGRYRVIAPDQSALGPIFPLLFNTDFRTRRMLQACDLMKARYRETAEQAYLDMYWKIRGSIAVRRPGS